MVTLSPWLYVDSPFTVGGSKAPAPGKAWLWVESAADLRGLLHLELVGFKWKQCHRGR